MAGELVPLVLLPRYTTYASKPASGNPWFTTIAMDVTQYESAILNVWRGTIVGTPTGSPPVKFWFEESTDQVVWTVCTGSPGGATGGDPGDNTEAQYTMTLAKRWFRVKVQLGLADNILSCWAVGFLEERLR
jgi:hypothetical protein